MKERGTREMRACEERAWKGVHRAGARPREPGSGQQRPGRWRVGDAGQRLPSSILPSLVPNTTYKDGNARQVPPRSFLHLLRVFPLCLDPRDPPLYHAILIIGVALWSASSCRVANRASQFPEIYGVGACDSLLPCRGGGGCGGATRDGPAQRPSLAQAWKFRG